MGKHPGSIDRHGSRWRIRLSVHGQRHVFTYDEDLTPAQIQQKAREKDVELRGRHGRALPGPTKFSLLLTRYRDAGMPGKRKQELAPLTKRSYETSLQAFETYFVQRLGDPATLEVRDTDVNDFMLWRRNHAPNGERRSEPVSARTVGKDRAILHRLFSWGRGLGLAESNPVEDTDAPSGDQREPLIINRNQYEALLRACQGRPMVALYVLVLGETGVRCDSEALWLRWEDVDLETGLLTIESVRKGRRTKSGMSRRAPMTPRLRKAMADHMAAYRLRTYNGKRTEWIFHHELKRRHANAGDRIGNLRRAFAGAVKRAKLPTDLRQHDLRHRRVTTWLAEGKPIKLVSKAMGHSSVIVTERYEHLVDEDLLSLVEEPTAAELRALVGR
jgi:integrase